jgi:hypothetical protein
VVLAMKQQDGAYILPPQAPAAARAVVLGLQLLQEVFSVHAEARREVLKVVQVRRGQVCRCIVGQWLIQATLLDDFIGLNACRRACQQQQQHTHKRTQPCHSLALAA